jgi:hypothetical protein
VAAAFAQLSVIPCICNNSNVMIRSASQLNDILIWRVFPIIVAAS